MPFCQTIIINSTKKTDLLAMSEVPYAGRGVFSCCQMCRTVLNGSRAGPDQYAPSINGECKKILKSLQVCNDLKFFSSVAMRVYR